VILLTSVVALLADLCQQLNPFLQTYQIYVHFSPYYGYLWLFTLFVVKNFLGFGH
jgi:hypothetical protein